MLRLVVLLFVCAAIAANNDTFGNLISNEEQSNLKKQPDNWSANNRTLDEQYKDAVQAYLEEDWSRCINDFNAVLQGYISNFEFRISNFQSKAAIIRVQYPK